MKNPKPEVGQILYYEKHGEMSPVQVTKVGLDVLPGLKLLGFWVQTERAAKGGLTSPDPREDAPSLSF